MSEHTSQPDVSGLRIRRDDPVSAHRPGSGGRVWFYVLPTVVLVALGIYFFGFADRGADQAVETATVQRISPASAQSLLTATGYVVAQRKAAVASKGTGRLEVLNVEEGDQVSSGDVIGRLESADVDAAARAAQATVTQAEAFLDQAKAVLHEAELDYNRVADLLAKKLTAQSAYDAAEARYLTAEADVNAAEAAVSKARADLRWAEVQVENTYIRAPFDGTVLTKSADVGEVVAPFAASTSSRGALVTLADMTSLEVEADVSESNIRKITIGQPCLITLDALPTEPYTGQVKKIVPTADRAKATVLTKISFDQLDDRVLPEMSAKVNFLPADGGDVEISANTVLTVPSTAVVGRNGRSVVFRVRDKRVSAVVVTPGEPIGGRIAVTGALEAGDVVVQAPPPGLADGDVIVLDE